MAMGLSPTKGPNSEINVTPLVDVVLVLLIIFMVVTPMLQRGKDVKLPDAASAKEDKEKHGDPLVVSITKDKRIFVDNTEYRERELGPVLERQLSVAKRRKLLLKGDKDLTVGDVRRLMDTMRGVGADGVALGVQELKKQ